MTDFRNPVTEKRKNMLVALCAAALLGPLGLFYASARGAIALLLMVLAYGVYDIAHMVPAWTLAHFASIVWAWLAVRRADTPGVDTAL